ncbi:MAG: sulfurtransferase [Nitrospiraceae bacterium]|nr:MAG: sulfurtransferase [Nitrospiraceae bacterium]
MYIKKGGTMSFHRKVLAGLFSLLFIVAMFAGQQTAYANGWEPLVETGWLVLHLGEEDMKPVYVGFVEEKPGDGKAKFEASHIPGSVYLGMNDLMSVMRGNNNAPDKTKFEALMVQLGISNNSRVVLYGSPAANPFVPGTYWMMKYFGHENVGILNGSFDKWTEEKRKTEKGAAKAGAAAAYKAKEGDSSIMANASYVMSKLKNEKVVIVDTRGEDEYKGEKKIDYIKAKGHIPGAVNLNFYPSNRIDSGLYKTAEELRKEYEQAGITKDKEIIIYCEGGPRASDTFFILKDLLGYPNVKTYVGGWLEWGNDAKYPVEK